MRERCEIGCGCGRKKRKALSAKQKAKMRAKANSAIAARSAQTVQAAKFRNRLIKTRLNICEKCPHSIQNERDKKFNLRLCHKQNRPIQAVASLLSAACPVGNFVAST